MPVVPFFTHLSNADSFAG